MRGLCGIGSPKALHGLRALVQLAWTQVARLVAALEVMELTLVVQGGRWPQEPAR